MTAEAWAPRAWFVSAREWLGRFPLSISSRDEIGVGLVFFNADC